MKRYSDKKRLDFLFGKYNGAMFQWDEFMHFYYDFKVTTLRQAIDAAIRESEK